MDNANYSRRTSLPVAVVGGGPVGLTAAAHLAARSIPFVLLESGDAVGSAVSEWAHVRMFSPWKYTVDQTAAALLAGHGWQHPPHEELPTGADLIARYINPLAQHPLIAPHIRLKAHVASVGRKDMDKVRSKGRDQQPFELRLDDGRVLTAGAVIDASGTWRSPNPLGSSGRAAAGERHLGAQIAYGIPDVLQRQRTRYANKIVAVAGSGHSAFNVILDLLTLAKTEPLTKIVWLVRRESLDTIWGGGGADELQARGELGTRARAAVEAGQLHVQTSFRVSAITRTEDGRIELRSDDAVVHADEVVVCAGFRPELDMLREVRVSLDAWLECPTALGPLIDPNEHSCGTVRPHGARELAHPEKDFYIVGMKSYGRAPTFLLATGFEQVRSVVAMLDGDVAAAERVQLVLPETGVCSTDSVGGSCCGTVPGEVATGVSIGVARIAPAAQSNCCGGPAPAGVDACCVDDADAKAAGATGCGCNDSSSPLLQIGKRTPVLAARG